MQVTKLHTKSMVKSWSTSVLRKKNPMLYSDLKPDYYSSQKACLQHLSLHLARLVYILFKYNIKLSLQGPTLSCHALTWGERNNTHIIIRTSPYHDEDRRKNLFYHWAEYNHQITYRNHVKWKHTSSCGIFLSFSASILTLTTPDLSTISWISFPFFPITFPTKRTFKTFNSQGFSPKDYYIVNKQNHLVNSKRTYQNSLILHNTFNRNTESYTCWKTYNFFFFLNSLASNHWNEGRKYWLHNSWYN